VKHNASVPLKAADLAAAAAAPGSHLEHVCGQADGLPTDSSQGQGRALSLLIHLLRDLHKWSNTAVAAQQEQQKEWVCVGVGRQ
jgi:hypothetical protein